MNQITHRWKNADKNAHMHHLSDSVCCEFECEDYFYIFFSFRMKCRLFVCMFLHVCVCLCARVFLQESLLDADHHVAVALGPQDKAGSEVMTHYIHMLSVSKWLLFLMTSTEVSMPTS